MRNPKLTRESLTIAEAASVLSEAVYERHYDSDIYRLALDGRLTLSIDLPPTSARSGPTVEWDDEAVRAFLNHEVGRGFGSFANTYAVGNYVLDTLDEPVVARGLWDVWLVGTARISVEHYWQMLTGRPFSSMQFHNWGAHAGGLVVVHEPNAASYCRLFGAYGDPDSPLIEFPSGSRYMVRTEALVKLIDELNGPNQTKIVGSKQALQEEELKRCLVELGYKLQSLPTARGPMGGPRKAARDALLSSRPDLFQSAGVFNKAWERLRSAGELRDGEVQ